MEEPSNTPSPILPRVSAMKLTRRTLGSAIGIGLILLEVPDVVYVLWNRVPFVTHLLPFALFVGLGTAFIWWGRQTPAPRLDDPPQLFWTIAAIVVGFLLLLYGLIVGLILSFVLSPGAALGAALFPWGLVGVFLLALGFYRLADSVRRSVARERAARLIWQAPGFEGALRGPGGETPFTPEVLGGVRSEILASARRLLTATSRTVRTILWTSLLFNALAVGWGALVGVLGPTLAPAAVPPLPYWVLGATVVTLGLIGTPICWYRLQSFKEAEARLAAGQVPEDWMLGYWGALRATIRFLSSRGSKGTTVPTPGESSVLADSMALLRFGNRLAYTARAAYTTFFLLFLLVGPIGLLLVTFGAGAYFSAGSPNIAYETLLGWSGVLALIAADFLFLYRRLRVVDEVTRRLQTLQEAETELARAFWSRF